MTQPVRASSPIGSEAEVGGVAGQEAARRLGNVIARTETLVAAGVR